MVGRQGAQIFKPSYMVGMAMCYQDGIGPWATLVKHLPAEVRAAVDKQPLPAYAYQRRCAPAGIVWVLRTTYLTIATYSGDTC